MLSGGSVGCGAVRGFVADRPRWMPPQVVDAFCTGRINLAGPKAVESVLAWTLRFCKLGGVAHLVSALKVRGVDGVGCRSGSPLGVAGQETACVDRSLEVCLRQLWKAFVLDASCWLASRGELIDRGGASVQWDIFLFVCQLARVRYAREASSAGPGSRGGQKKLGGGRRSPLDLGRAWRGRLMARGDVEGGVVRLGPRCIRPTAWLPAEGHRTLEG